MQFEYGNDIAHLIQEICTLTRLSAWHVIFFVWAFHLKKWSNVRFLFHNTRLYVFKIALNNNDFVDDVYPNKAMNDLEICGLGR